MAKTIWNKADRDSLLAGFAELKADQVPLWGKMSPSQMVRHCTLPLLAAMGELKVKKKFSPFRNWPMRKLIIYVFPFPKSVPTAPEFIVTDEGDLRERLRDLQATLLRFVERGEKQAFVEHTAFGRLSGKDWGALMYRHLDHHLKQFNQ